MSHFTNIKEEDISKWIIALESIIKQMQNNVHLKPLIYEILKEKNFLKLSCASNIEMSFGLRTEYFKTLQRELIKYTSQKETLVKQIESALTNEEKKVLKIQYFEKVKTIDLFLDQISKLQGKSGYIDLETFKIIQTKLFTGPDQDELISTYARLKKTARDNLKKIDEAVLLLNKRLLIEKNPKLIEQLQSGLIMYQTNKERIKSEEARLIEIPVSINYSDEIKKISPKDKTKINQNETFYSPIDSLRRILEIFMEILNSINNKRKKVQVDIKENKLNIEEMEQQIISLKKQVRYHEIMENSNLQEMLKYKNQKLEMEAFVQRMEDEMDLLLKSNEEEKIKALEIYKKELDKDYLIKKKKKKENKRLLEKEYSLAKEVEVTKITIFKRNFIHELNILPDDQLEFINGFARIYEELRKKLLIDFNIITEEAKEIKRLKERKNLFKRKLEEVNNKINKLILNLNGDNANCSLDVLIELNQRNHEMSYKQMEEVAEKNKELILKNEELLNQNIILKNELEISNNTILKGIELIEKNKLLEVRDIDFEEFKDQNKIELKKALSDLLLCPTKEKTHFFSFKISLWSSFLIELLGEEMKHIMFVDEKQLNLENSKSMFKIITHVCHATGSKSSIWYGNELNRKFNNLDYKSNTLTTNNLLKRAQNTYFDWYDEDAAKDFSKLKEGKGFRYSLLLRSINNASIPRRSFNI